jgi:hypothetical protein
MTCPSKLARRQFLLDRFYTNFGPCCAGCDWWQHQNSWIGECIKSAPVSGEQRAAMLGIAGISLPIGAGHALTDRAHYCGDFKDEFDWSTLPVQYLKEIGRRA